LRGFTEWRANAHLAGLPTESGVGLERRSEDGKCRNPRGHESSVQSLFAAFMRSTAKGGGTR